MITDLKKTSDIQNQSMQAREEPSEHMLKDLLAHFDGGRLAEAEALASELVRVFPGHQFAWKVLGAVFAQTGRLEQSLAANQTRKVEPRIGAA